jgi:membrane protein
VAGLGFAAQASASETRAGDENRLGDLVIASVAAATRTSGRGRWLALILGVLATLVAAAAVLEVLRWVHLLAWRLPPARSRTSPWLVLGLIAGIAVISFTSTVAEQARGDAKGLASELTVLLTSAGVQLVVLAVLWLALTLAMPRPAGVPWNALVPGACLFAVGYLAFILTVSLYFAPRAARASTVYGSLGVALTLLVSLFLFARLAVAAAELNATLWERRRPAR